MYQYFQELLTQSITVPMWSVAVVMVLNVLLVMGAALLGYWRGSTLPVRTIQAIALAFLACPFGLIAIETFLEVEVEALSWESVAVACVAIVCLTLIEIWTKSASTPGPPLEDAGGEQDGHHGMQNIYESIVYDWVEAVADDESEFVDLRRTVLYAIVRKDYPGKKVHESPSINWPDDWSSYSKQWNLIAAVWRALVTHGERQLPAIENDFQTAAEALRDILKDGPS